MGGIVEFFLIFMFPVFLEVFLYLQVALGMVDAPAPPTAIVQPASLLPEHGFGFVTTSRDARFAAAWKAGLAKLPEAERTAVTERLQRFNALRGLGFKTDVLKKLATEIAHVHLLMDDATKEMPSFAMLIEMRTEAAARTFATDPGQYAELQRPARVRDTGGFSVTEVRLKQAGRVYLAQHGKIVVASIAPPLVQRYVKLLQNPPKANLAGTARYKKSIFAGEGAPGTGVYVDVQNVMSAVRRMMSRRESMELDQVDAFIGLSDIDALQGGLRVTDAGTTLELEILHDAESRPLDVFFPTGAKADATVSRLLGPGTMFTAQLQLADTASLIKVRDFLLSREKDLDTNDMTQAIAEVERFLGGKIEEVAKELRGQVMVAMDRWDFGKMYATERSESDRDYPGPPFAFIVPFKDAEAGAARMRKIVDFIAGESGPKGKVESKTIDGVTVLEFARRPRGAAAMLGNNMVITLPADHIKTLIKAHNDKSAVGPPALTKTAGDDATLRLGYSVSGLFSFGGLFMSGGMRSAPGMRAMPVRPGAKPFKPKAAKLTPFAAPQVGGLHSTLLVRREKGVLRLRSVHPGHDYVQRAVDLTKLAAYVERQSVAASFTQLYTAAQKYEHVKKAWPKRWEEIAAARREMDYVYVPSGGRGFVLNPAPKADVAEKDRALIYSRRLRVHGGRLVLFADGSVRWVPTAEFGKVRETNGLATDDPAEVGSRQGTQTIRRER